MQPEIGKSGPTGRHGRGGNRSGIGGNPRNAQTSQQHVCVVLEPAGMARFTHEVRVGPVAQHIKETLCNLRFELQARRQLHQHNTELVAKAFNLLEKTPDKILAVGKPSSCVTALGIFTLKRKWSGTERAQRS